MPTTQEEAQDWHSLAVFLAERKKGVLRERCKKRARNITDELG